MEDQTNAAAVITLCSCGHSESLHARGRDRQKQIRRLSCTHYDAATLKFCKCEEFREARSIAKLMNPEEGEGVSIVMAKQGRKVVLFEVTSKKADELLDKANVTNAAIFYRVLVAADKPMTRVAIYEASKTKCESGAAWERLGNQTHDTLARLRKAGFVKRIETREAVEAKAAAPKKPRAAKSKPRKAKPNGAAAAQQDVSDKDIPQNEATA